MVQITDTLIRELADLSKLHVEESQIATYKEDLKNMVDFVEQLNEVDTDNVEPLLHITPNVNIFRTDIVEGSCTREEALANAPKTDGVYFLVPKVIHK